MPNKRRSTFQLPEPAAPDSLRQRILLWFLQVFGAIAVVIFGTFSVLAWKDAEQAKAQADIANLVSFLSFCGDVASNSDANDVSTF
jgi:ABC-type multidrug transport system fused ATPase/permease subunit